MGGEEKKMNCNELTEFIKTIAGQKQAFEVAINQEKPDIQTASEIMKNVEKMREMCAWDKKFLVEIEKKRTDFIPKIRTLLQTTEIFNNKKGIEVIDHIIQILSESIAKENFPKPNLTTLKYKLFLKNYLNSQACREMVSIADVIPNLSEEDKISFRKVLSQPINTLFLNYACGEDEIVLESLPAPLFNFFAIRLNNPKARIRLGKAGDFLANGMISGHIKVMETGVRPGEDREGGSLDIGPTKND